VTDFEQRFSSSLRPIYLGLHEAGLSDASLDGGCGAIVFSSSSSSPPARASHNNFHAIESCELFQAVTVPPSGRSFESIYRRWSGQFFPWSIREGRVMEQFDAALAQWRRTHPSSTDMDLLRFFYEWPFDPQGLGMRYRSDNPERTADQAIAAREGDCSELTKIYLALAPRAGLSAYAVWVSRDNRGDLSPHLAAAVNLGGRTYFLDPAYDPRKNTSLSAQAGYDPLLPGHQAFGRISLRELLAWHWSDTGANLGERGRVLLDPEQKRRTLQSALEALQRAAEIDSYNPWIYANRGVVHFYRGEAGEARSDFNRALALDSSNPQALSGLGDLHYQTGAYPEAARDYGRALQVDPGQTNYREYLIRSLFYSGRPDEARREFRSFPANHASYSSLRILLNATP
jgi:tetratricopeptide (TPR) repeat protein